jgi:hypothetical protein
MTESENIKLADAKIGAILNTASGSCSPESLSEIEAIFAEYALTPVKIWCVDSSELSDALDDFKRQNLDVLIILGGDGTIRSAAERCTAAGPEICHGKMLYGQRCKHPKSKIFQPEKSQESVSLSQQYAAHPLFGQRHVKPYAKGNMDKLLP